MDFKGILKLRMHTYSASLKYYLLLFIVFFVGYIVTNPLGSKSQFHHCIII